MAKNTNGALITELVSALQTNLAPYAPERLNVAPPALKPAVTIDSLLGTNLNRSRQSIFDELLANINAAYAASMNEQTDNERAYIQALANVSDTALDTMRDQYADDTAAGANRGMQAANILSAILGMQNSSIDGVNTLFGNRSTLLNQKATDTAQASTNATDLYTSLQQYLADYAKSLYETDSTNHTTELASWNAYIDALMSAIPQLSYYNSISNGGGAGSVGGGTPVYTPTVDVNAILGGGTPAEQSQSVLSDGITNGVTQLPLLSELLNTPGTSQPSTGGSTMGGGSRRDGTASGSDVGNNYTLSDYYNLTLPRRTALGQNTTTALLDAITGNKTPTNTIPLSNTSANNAPTGSKPLSSILINPVADMYGLNSVPANSTPVSSKPLSSALINPVADMYGLSGVNLRDGNRYTLSDYYNLTLPRGVFNTSQNALLNNTSSSDDGDNKTTPNPQRLFSLTSYVGALKDGATEDEAVLAAVTPPTSTTWRAPQTSSRVPAAGVKNTAKSTHTTSRTTQPASASVLSYPKTPSSNTGGSGNPATSISGILQNAVNSAVSKASQSAAATTPKYKGTGVSNSATTTPSSNGGGSKSSGVSSAVNKALTNVLNNVLSNNTNTVNNSVKKKSSKKQTPTAVAFGPTKATK